MTRCCICGRFMSDDQVLLGFSKDVEGGQEYAHKACVEKRLVLTAAGDPNK